MYMFISVYFVEGFVCAGVCRFSFNHSLVFFRVEKSICQCFMHDTICILKAKAAGTGENAKSTADIYLFMTLQEGPPRLERIRVTPAASPAPVPLIVFNFRRATRTGPN